MPRANGTTLGTWTIAAVMLAAVLALVVPGAFLSHAAPAPTSASPHPSMSHAVPAAVSAPRPAVAHPGASGPVNGSVAITTTYSGAMDVPVEVDWTISVTNVTLNALNVSMSLLVMNGANEIANLSQATVTAQTTYTTMVDYAALDSQNYNGGVLPTTPYTFTVWMQVQNVSNGSVPWLNVSSNSPTVTLKIAHVSTLITSVTTLYTALPFTFDFTTAYGGNTGSIINKYNVTISIELRLVTSGCNSIFGQGAPCPTVANNSIKFNSTNTYDLSIDVSYFTSGLYANGQLPTGEYQVLVWNSLSNITNPAQEPRTSAAAIYVYPVLHPNSVTWLSPSPLQPVTLGNVSLAVQYLADYLSGATLTVFAGAGTTGTVQYTTGVFQASVYSHAGGGVWVATVPGQYTAEVTLITVAGAAAGASNFTMMFNVTSNVAGGGGTVYFNSTIYQNSTVTQPVAQNLIGSLSTGVAAAILLVVGLIVGIIVAMVLGRMMWGGGSQPPAQPWSGASKNECSVCHQSFPSEAELKDHQKQAHGMG